MPSSRPQLSLDAADSSPLAAGNPGYPNMRAFCQQRTATSTTSNVPSEQSETSQDLVEGLRLLDIALPDHITKKVTVNYKGMTPMDRFMLETLNGDDARSGSTNNACDAAPSGPRSSCASCVATVGGGNDCKAGNHGQE